MRHLHFVQSLEPLQGGGLGAAALGLHLALEQAAIQSRLVTTKEQDFCREWPGVLQVTRRGPGKVYFSPETARTAMERILHADVVHGHGLYTHLNWVFGKLARKYGMPVVYHTQGFFDPWILARSRLRKKVVHFLFEDANFRHARLWRALTGKEERQIRDQGITAPVVVAPNGLDLREIDENIHSEERPEHRKENRVLSLGRIHPKKGLDLLVDAWRRLHERFPNWEVLIVGPDEGGHQASIERQIRSAGLESSCRIIGAVTGNAKWFLFRSAQLFVLPSYSEGFPVAVLEAAGHRLPVVITDECNFPELGLAGGAWIAKPTAESVTEALRMALEADDTERRDRGLAGRSLIEREYTWDKIAIKINEACRSLV